MIVLSMKFFSRPLSNILSDFQSFISGRLPKQSKQMYLQSCAHTTSSTLLGLVKVSGTSCGFRFNTTITLTMIHKDWAAQHTTVGSANAGLVGIRASNIGGESVLT